MVVCMLLCCFKGGWIAPHNYNDHKGQINGVVLIQSRNDEHTLGFRDQVKHVQTIHREVNTLELTSRTMADRWLLFEPVKLWFNLLNVYVHIKTHSHTYTHTHTHALHPQMHRLPVWRLLWSHPHAALQGAEWHTRPASCPDGCPFYAPIPTELQLNHTGR